MSKPISFPGQGSFVVDRKNRSGKSFSNMNGPILSGAYPTGDIPSDPPIKTDGPNDDGTINPPALPSLPTFPDFSVMGCKELGAQIEYLKQTVNAPSLVANSPEWTAAYMAAINNATALYNSKGCATSGDTQPVVVTVNNNPPLITSGTGVPGASAGFPTYGGGGGGGSSAGATAATKAKKPFPWLWVVIGGAVLYFITKKSS